MKRIILIAVLVLVAIVLFAFVKPPQKEAAPSQAGQVTLAPLGVAVQLPQGLEGLAVATSTVEGLGPVVRVAVPPAPGVEGTACELGVFYNVSKASIDDPGSPWTKEQLDAASVVNGQIPPQAKEFPEFYFVFEPAQTPCTTNPDQLQIEAALRQALWISVATATLQPA